MKVIIIYDINTIDDNTRIRKVHNICSDYGVQLQKSVFKLDVNMTELNNILDKLKNIITADDNIIYFKVNEINSLNSDAIIKDYKHDLLIY